MINPPGKKLGVYSKCVDNALGGDQTNSVFLVKTMGPVSQRIWSPPNVVQLDHIH